MKKSMRIFLCLALSLTAVCAEAQVGVGVSIRIGPPALPVYTQPPCPYDGYLWTPGYWAYGDDGYYWVPGVWVSPPQVGFLWTPGYWGYDGGFYGWHVGYWGPHVGYYGGINYGYGYGGSGFGGGVWAGGHFRYNTAVVNVNRTVIHNTYIDRTVVHTTANRTSFNGPGGITVRPNAQEQAVMHENHIQRTTAQATHEQTAGRDRNQFASVNHGRPANLAMNRVNGTAFHPHTQVSNAGSINHAPAQNHSTPVNGGNAGRDQFHGQQQQHVQQQHVQQQHVQQQQHMPSQQPQQHMQQQHVQPQHVQPQHMQAPPQHMEQHENPRPEGGGGEHHRGR
jgi:hypothetical protein